MSSFITYVISGNTGATGNAELFSSGALDPYGVVVGDGIIRSGGVVGVAIQDTGYAAGADFIFDTEIARIPIVTVIDASGNHRIAPVARAHDTTGAEIDTTDMTLYTTIPVVNERIRLTVAGTPFNQITAYVTVAIDPHAEPDS